MKKDIGQIIRKLCEEKKVDILEASACVDHIHFFSMDPPKDMQGKPLYDTLKSDTKIRDFALFGQHGVHVNVTDGKYVYICIPAEGKEVELHNYVQIPMSYPNAIGVEEMKTIEVHPGFSFTKGSRVIRMKGGNGVPEIGFPPKQLLEYDNMLFNVEDDPKQMNPLIDKTQEERMIRGMVQIDAGQRRPDGTVCPHGAGRLYIKYSCTILLIFYL